MDIVRDKAVKIIYDVFEKDAYANIALDKQLKGSSFTPLERRFLTELSYGTIRAKNTLQWVIDKFVKRTKIQPWIRYILYIGVYQIFFMDKVPDSAACNESVELAKKYGNKGSVKFVNGVLRNIVRKKNQIKYPELEKNPVKHIALKYHHPEWMVERWLNLYGTRATIELCKYNNNPGLIHLRTNTLKVTREELKKILQEEGIETRYSDYSPEGLIVTKMESSLGASKAFREGKFLIQDEASQLVARVVSPEKNSLIVDASAAPGGKTTHLGQLIENEGKIEAFDIHPHRLKLIEENCKKLGITCVSTSKRDARDLWKIYNKEVDYLLLDVPCTGMGVLRRPDARWKKTEENILELSKLQKEIITSAAKCVKKGGILVYSTCSINPEENIEVIKYFLKNNKDFKLESLLPFLSPNLLKDTQDKKSAEAGYIELLPYKHNCDGFFICRIKRVL